MIPFSKKIEKLNIFSRKARVSTDARKQFITVSKVTENRIPENVEYAGCLQCLAIGEEKSVVKIRGFVHKDIKGFSEKITVNTVPARESSVQTEKQKQKQKNI